MLPYLLLVFTVLFWSGNFVLGRGIHELIPPVSLNFRRWAGALLILLAVVFLGERIRWYHLWGMALIFTGIGLTAVIRAPVAAGNR